jgi:Domain of unknown function (DUF4386)
LTLSEAATGIVLLAVPLLFNVTFLLLAQRFDYPDILRQPTSEVLERFAQGGSALILIWWAFALSAVGFAALVMLLPLQVGDAGATTLTLSVLFGLLASIVQFLGLIRWPFLVPYLAREAQSAEPGSPRAEAVDVVFQSLNRYLGVAVGEHLGYGLTGAWSIFTGVALVQSDAFPGWLGVVGIVIGPAFLLSALEFVGPFEPKGWELAGKLVPIAYIVWSLWLLALGVAVLT